jgi:glutaredoxin
MSGRLVGGCLVWIGLACALSARASEPEVVEEVRGAQVEQVRPGAARPPAARKLPRVEVYVTDWCPYCQKLAAFLKQNGVPYVRKNIEKDARYEREHEALGGGGIPLTRIGGERIVRGFQPDLIAQELGLEPAD